MVKRNAMGRVLSLVCVGIVLALVSLSVQVSESHAASPEARIDILDLNNMEIQDVIKLISKKSGWNIVAGQSIKGRISIYLKDISVEEVLRIIVESNGWAYHRTGDLVQIMTESEYEQKFGKRFGQEVQTEIVALQYAKTADILAVLNQMKTNTGKVITDERSGTVVLMDQPERVLDMKAIISRLDKRVVTEIFDLHYAKAENVVKKIDEFLTPQLGQVKFDERMNKIIVTDLPSKIPEIFRIIEEIDGREPEVLIEAKILQVTLSDDHKMGVDWRGLVQQYHNLSFTSDFDVLSPNEKRGEVSIGVFDNDEYEFILQALDEVGYTDILSSPRITVLNNKEAKFLVGSTEPYVTTTTTTPSTGPTVTAETVNFIDVGVQLYVTPTIHPDGFITMQIKPEVSSVTDTLTTGNNNVIPVVETSEAETTVMVKDDVTIVIGGLIKDEMMETVRKVPVLGDIPGIRYAFRSESDSKTKTEIAIFLTPKIISGDQDMQ